MRFVKLPTLLVGAVLLLQGCASVLFAGFNTADERSGVAATHAVVFDEKHGLALDIYRPPRAAHAPIAVFFYGGSWMHGERAWYRFVGSALAARGIITIVADYRKVPAVHLDGFMRDAASAVAWTHAHAAEIGGDGGDIFVMGHSAGGQIAALLATDRRWLEDEGLSPGDLAGCIGLAGVYDFLPIAAGDDEMLAVFGRDEVQQRRGDPIAFVRGGEPAMLLLHGSDDHEVDPAQSTRFAAALRARGDEVAIKSYAGVGHSALLFAMARPLRTHASTLDDIVAFIRAHPGAEARATTPATSLGPSAAAP